MGENTDNSSFEFDNFDIKFKAINEGLGLNHPPKLKKTAPLPIKSYAPLSEKRHLGVRIARSPSASQVSPPSVVDSIARSTISPSLSPNAPGKATENRDNSISFSYSECALGLELLSLFIDISLVVLGQIGITLGALVASFGKISVAFDLLSDPRLWWAHLLMFAGLFIFYFGLLDQAQTLGKALLHLRLRKLKVKGHHGSARVRGEDEDEGDGVAFFTAFLRSLLILLSLALGGIPLFFRLPSRLSRTVLVSELS